MKKETSKSIGAVIAGAAALHRDPFDRILIAQTVIEGPKASSS